MIMLCVAVTALLRAASLYQVIGDHEAAVTATETAIKQAPDSLDAAAAYVQALARAGFHREAASAYAAFLRSFEDSQGEIGEAVAWSTLEAGLASGSMQTRLIALLGAARACDARSVDAVVEMLRSSHALGRLIAIRLGTDLKDAPIRDEIRRLFFQERVRAVRLEVIAAVGALKMVQMRPILEAWIASEQTSAEEKGAAIGAVVALLDTLKEQEVRGMLEHPRGGLRQLACRAIGVLELSHIGDGLARGLFDPLPEVREAALEAFGMLRGQWRTDAEILELVRPCLKDGVPEVAIRAAWLVAQLEADTGQAALEMWLGDRRADIARLAAGAISACGAYGVALAQAHLNTHPDPYVRANLAMGLLSQRMSTESAAKQLLSVLTAETGQWMWETHGTALRVLVPSRVRHEVGVPNRPELDDQLTRLEVLGYLAVVRADGVSSAVREFLRRARWGVSGTAAISLLQEGDEAALGVVHDLLEDPDRKLRVQAALALGIWGRDPDAASTLIEAYEGAGRELKMQILEALGHIASQDALPFLVNCLKQRSLTLRVVAASAIIQCLNA